MGDFKRLAVWRASHALAVDMYRHTTEFPVDERFGLCAQIRRAAASIAANIAESSGRFSDSDQSRILQIALGSARELEAHLRIAQDLGFASQAQTEPVLERVDNVQRMLSGLVRFKVRQQSRSKAKRRDVVG